MRWAWTMSAERRGRKRRNKVCDFISQIVLRWWSGHWWSKPPVCILNSKLLPVKMSTHNDLFHLFLFCLLQWNAPGCLCLRGIRKEPHHPLTLSWTVMNSSVSVALFVAGTARNLFTTTAGFNRFEEPRVFICLALVKANTKNVSCNVLWKSTL